MYLRGEVIVTNLLMESNKVLLFGKGVAEPKFSHEVFGENFYENSIEVKRLSESSDVIPVIFSERLLNIDEIKNGTIFSNYTYDNRINLAN